MSGNIDWTQLVTKEMKANAAAEHFLAVVVADVAVRRAAVDAAIAPLQDAVDLDEATVEEAGLLTAWKKYRVLLNRVTAQPGYPTSIDWPVAPA